MMLKNDDRMWRLLFFCAYTTEVCIQYIVQGFVVYTMFSHEYWQRDLCTDFELRH